jgi:hypothetical protein
MTILHSQCLPTELVKTANAVAINSVSGPVTGAVAPTSAPATGASVWYIDTSTTPDNLYYWNGSVWTLTGDGTGSVASVLLTQDESIPLGSATTMNFAGAGVVATHAAGVTTVTIPGGSGTFATNAEAQAGTSAALLINPANLYARENIAAQTGVSTVLASIAAPTAGQSNWAVNTLGETLNYVPGVGWRIVADMVHEETYGGAITGAAMSVVATLKTYVAPRAGRVHATVAIIGGAVVFAGANLSTWVAVNGNYYWNQSGTTPNSLVTGTSQTASTIVTVAAGDVLTFYAYSVTGYSISAYSTSLTYIN